ncbi:MAG: histidine kinase dimerization/phosphoacceptor domain -containing protein [Methanobacteriaceae archaeon]|nr:histidine kinase dimerization/phosphoacceptor domain -containing protein [Methanobacteriaceae archaeon]
MEVKRNLLVNIDKPKFFKKIIIALAIFLLIFLITALFSSSPTLIYYMITILYLMVTISLFLAARSVGEHDIRLKLAWSFLTVSVLFSAAANILWAIIDLYYKVNPTTSVADILYLLFYPIFFLGIMAFPSKPKTNHQRFKAYFDMFMIIFSIILILYTFFISPALGFYEGDTLKLIFSLAYVIGGFILLIAMLDLIFNRITSKMQTPLLYLLAGIVILTVISTVYAYKLLIGTYIPGGVEDLGWIIGYSFLGLAGAAQYTNYKIENKIITKLFDWHYSYHWTPYLALTGIFVTYTLLIWSFNTSNSNLLIIELGCGMVIFMVVLRQIISIRENRSLYHDAENELKKRQIIQEKLKKSENLYKTIFENTGSATFIISKDKIILKNTEFKKISGYDSHTLTNTSWRDLVTPQSREKITEICDEMKKEVKPKPRNLEIQFIHKNGELKDGFLIFTLIPESEDILGSLLDITQHKKDQNIIKQSLEEKELLLKEIHHRVKNNLMIISSLLSLQSRYIDNQEQMEVLKESQSRANSMALIHERLYQGSDLKHINFGDYIQKLAPDIFHNYSSTDTQINLKIDAENLMLDIDTAIPLGLILNELLTNAMKHAFPQDIKGEIMVKFYQEDENYILRVKDDGKGIASDLDPETIDSLGMQIINNLTRQINGKLEITNSNGACFQIRFSEEAYE